MLAFVLFHWLAMYYPADIFQLAGDSNYNDTITSFLLSLYVVQHQHESLRDLEV